MKRIKTIRIGFGITLMIAGLVCAWFWWTAANQQSELASAMIRSPDDLREHLPLLSAAFRMLDVDIFAPSDDSMGVVMELSGQFWRRTLLGVVIGLVGIGTPLGEQMKHHRKMTGG